LLTSLGDGGDSILSQDGDDSFSVRMTESTPA
jgi:hypothetical protein